MEMSASVIPTGYSSLFLNAKVKVELTLGQAMKAQRVSRGVALLFSNLSARWRWMVNATL
jgi:hypothetical protein